MQNHAVSDSDIVQALLNNPLLKFQDKGEYLRKGECPECGRNELYLRKSQPYQVACSREGNCGYTESTRNLVPELFSQYTERFPKTESDPNATADAYLSHNRGFPIIKMRGWYEQHTERWEIEPGKYEYCEGIRFYLDAERTRYWSRLIDRTGKEGHKAHFAGKRKADKTLFRGDAWAPPGMEINDGDKVYIVEGIFHAIAFWAAGFKAIAAFSCNNFPINFISQYKGKRITWCIALDEGEAGRKYALKFTELMAEAKEKSQVYLPPNAETDWDDLYRAGQLVQTELNDCEYRGKLFFAKDIASKAYHWHLKTKRRYGILDHNNRLYEVKISKDLESALQDKNCELESGEGREVFQHNIFTGLISNCLPTFLYMERDEVMDEQRFVFRFDYSNGAASEIIALDGNNIESPAAFNKALLNRTRGGTFDGGAQEFKNLRDSWLNRKMLIVQSNPFIGYDADLKAYIFPKFAFYRGRDVALNPQGYFQLDAKRLVKVSSPGFNLVKGEPFNPSWFNDYLKVFNWHGFAALAWWTGSYFCEQIRRKQSSWCFFELTGEQGAGKSTILEFLWKLTGRDGHEGFNPGKSSQAGRRRAFNQGAGLPVCLIEGDREETGDAKKGGFNFDELKDLYNGRATGTLGIAKRGYQTDEPLFKGSVLFAQNATVDASQAMLARIVHSHVTKEHHTPGMLPLARKFEQFTAKEVGGYLSAALTQEKAWMETYLAEFQRAEQDLIHWGEVKDLLIIKCHAQVYAFAVALSLLFPQIKT